MRRGILFLTGLVVIAAAACANGDDTGAGSMEAEDASLAQVDSAALPVLDAGRPNAQDAASPPKDAADDHLAVKDSSVDAPVDSSTALPADCDLNGPNKLLYTIEALAALVTSNPPLCPCSSTMCCYGGLVCVNR